MKSPLSFVHGFLPPRPPSLASSPPLNRAITQTFIIACTESTENLEATLTANQLNYEVLRQQQRPEYAKYARSALALLNHCQAWQRATQVAGLTLVVEADFVPVQNFGGLPLPFPWQQSNLGLAWLYTCAAQIYSVTHTGHARGFSSSMVAYLITPESAIALLEIVSTLRQLKKPTAYMAWDSKLEEPLRKRGFENFVPFRNYGEHGGQPNPEHKHNGLSMVHRADVLYDPLAFPPLYAFSTGKQISQASSYDLTVGDRLRYWRIRSKARVKGLGRLMLGRFLHAHIVRESSVPLWLLHFAIRRHLSIYL